MSDSKSQPPPNGQDPSTVSSSAGAPGSARTGSEAGGPASNDVVQLQAEIARLTQAVAQLTAERDALRRAANKLAAQQITPDDLERWGEIDSGLPLEAFIGELEQIIEGKPNA